MPVSNINAEDLRKANSVHPIAAIQNEYSLLHREDEHSVLPASRDLSISYVAYSPMARGILSEKFDINSTEETDWRRLPGANASTGLFFPAHLPGTL